MTQTRPAFASDLLVDLLLEVGIDHVAFSPGATFRALHDSLVNYRDDAPGIVLCTHEEISVAISHGYAKAADRPMAAALHDLVGLQHASMAVYNAWCDRVPVLLLGGAVALEPSRRRPWIDAVHSADAQALPIRDYTKRHVQPPSVNALPSAIYEAMALATTSPCGPVYVSIYEDVQEAALSSTDAGAHGFKGYAPPALLGPDPEAVAQLADWLLDSDRTVVVAEVVGRDPDAFALLTECAELLGVPVVELEREYNRPSLCIGTSHPLNLSGSAQEVLAEADLVLGLGIRDGATLASLLSGCDRPRLVVTSTQEVVHRGWANDAGTLIPCDLRITADVRPLLGALLDRLRQSNLMADLRRRRRIDALAARAEANRQRWRREASAACDQKFVTPSSLAAILGEATASHDRLLANGHLGNWVHRLWNISDPRKYLGDNGGAGLGYGLGASIGAALARPYELVVDIQSDGDALMTPGALWTAAHHQIPLLVVMDNNRAYGNSVQHAESIARLRGRSELNRGVGTTIRNPDVDFAGLARAFGMEAFGPIYQNCDLVPVLDNAVSVVTEERRPVLVDVVTDSTANG